MQTLNLPPVALRIGQTDGKRTVFDPLRKRHVALTPEEWVRQHFVAYLIDAKGYPAGLIGNEISLRLNNRRRRCDTVVYDRTGKPVVIVEYKSPAVPLSQSVFEQAARYNLALRVDYLIISNGLSHHCCRIDYENRSYRFLETIPCYDQL